MVRPYGLAMGGGWGLIVSHMTELLVIFSWVRVTMEPLFYALKLKVLRITVSEQIAGLDISSDGGYA